MRDLGLTDKVVLITGGGGVLGSAFARGFADSGAKRRYRRLRARQSGESRQRSNMRAAPMPSASAPT